MTGHERGDEALGRVLARRARGEPVSIAAMAAGDPDLAALLREEVHVLEMLDRLRKSEADAEELPAAPPSVLASLSNAGVLLAPLTLADAPSEGPAPVAIPSSSTERLGRFAVEGEIGRGGVGIVWKARDGDLGRTVAVKVLRPEYAGRPDVLQRFIEEAQVGGQLQHPGIVPVHEMGLQADGQPYFVMKMVKGRTLTALLAERDGSSKDVRALLVILEAVCQTVAYAHARGIVHRDLKPGNIMVGAFGEVQVVDWGMAKVLARHGPADGAGGKVAPAESIVTTARSASGSAPSLVGSVMGTPGYMPPEQARGALELLDERADVFALGAILCECLTGSPPYVGDPAEVLISAAQGHVQPAIARLAASGADPGLVGLATRCLSAAIEGRPRHAGVVARELTHHLVTTEERARSAQTEAAEARVRAEGERKRRRTSVAFAATVAGLVMLGSAGWLFVEAERRSRADEVSRAVTQALDEVTALRSRAAAGTDLGTWQEALWAARRADALASSPDASDATRGRTSRTLTDLEGAVAAAVEAQGEAEARRRLVETLDAIRQDRSTFTQTKQNTNQRYERAFAELGLHLSEGAGAVAQGNRVRASPISQALVGALDDWRSVRRSLDLPTDTLSVLLSAADSDPWRADLRACRTLEVARALARGVDVSSKDPVSLVALVDLLGSMGDFTAAADLARRAQLHHPGDFWLNHWAAFTAMECKPPRREDAVRFFSVALSLRPTTAAWTNLGCALLDTGRQGEESIECFTRAWRMEPGKALPLANLGAGLIRQGDLPGAVEALQKAILLEPEDAGAREALSVALFDTGDLRSSEGEIRIALRLEPTSHRYAQLSTVLLEGGDSTGALSAAREATRMDDALAEAHYVLGKALGASNQLAGALPEFRAAIRLDATLAEAHSGLGAVLVMQGDWVGAMAASREALRLDPKTAPARVNLGVGLVSTGDLPRAIDEWREAIRLDPRLAPPHAYLWRHLPLAGRYAEALVALARCRELADRLPGWKPPTVEEVQLIERLAAAERQLPAFVEGRFVPESAQDAADLARVAVARADYPAAVEAYVRTFALDPTRTRAIDSLYNAACAAARAGAGQGSAASVLDAGARWRLRGRSVAWLQAALEVLARPVGNSALPPGHTARSVLEWFTTDPDLASLRGDEALAALPDYEQPALRALWAEVARLLAQERAAK